MDGAGPSTGFLSLGEAPSTTAAPGHWTGRGSVRRTRVRKSAAAVMLEVDESMAQVLGWTAGDLVGKTSLDFIHPKDQALAVENWMQMLTAPGPSCPLRLRHRHRDGSWIWVELTNHNLLDDPSERCVVAEMIDVSAEMPDDSDEIPDAGTAPNRDRRADGRDDRPLALHEALRAREQLLHRLAESLPVGVLHVDAHGRVLYSNKQLHAIVGKPRAASFVDQLSAVLAEDAPRITEAFESALRGGLDSDVECRVATSEQADGKEIRQCTLSVRTLVSDAGEVTGVVVCIADVTESLRMRDELRMQATFDKLTHCYNRASTMDALDATLVGDGGGSTAVVFVDLDDFKDVNDHWGHAAGDELLEIVARRLCRAVRDGDVVGRIGGDEFLVLCPGIGSAAQALRAATRVAQSLRHTVKLRAGEVSCRASVGVAWSADAGLDADTLIGQADAAMYEAKRSGLGRPVIYRAAS